MLKQYLFRHQGHIGAYLVVAGCDSTGSHLFTVHAHGSTDKLPYVTMGSGSMAAMAIFETQWKGKLTREDAVKLCSDAILAGIFNDLGSGSNVDVCVITPEKATLMRNYITPNKREKKLRNYKFPTGSTAVLNQKVITKEDISKYVTVHELDDPEVEGVAEKMDVDA
jgi:20S proteasome subunit beta 2